MLQHREPGARGPWHSARTGAEEEEKTKGEGLVRGAFNEGGSPESPAQTWLSNEQNAGRATGV